MHPELSPVAFLAAFSLILPLPWHWRAKNIATLSIIAYLFVLNIIYAIDAYIWSQNVKIVAKLWCDITTKFIIGAGVALPAACLCICVHLEQVASMRLKTRVRRNVFELVMCCGLPLLVMALHYIVQGHRFDIFEDYGCRAAIYFSIPSIIIIYAPAILISVGALIFAGLALRHFIIRRLTFLSHLSSSRSALTTSHYFRLMAMSIMQMFWSLSLTIYNLWFTTLSVPLRPYTSWSDVHSDFLRIDRFPAVLTPIEIRRAFNVLWWLPVISTFLFVIFFSFGKDAMAEYNNVFVWVKTRFTLFSPRLKGFRRFSKPELPVSYPTLVGSSNPAVSCKQSELLTSPTLSSSSDPFRSFSSESKNSHYLSGTTILSEDYRGPKAIGSVRDLSVHWPSASKGHFLNSKPLPELPELPRLYPGPRGMKENGTFVPRPLTYPSHQNTSAGVEL